MKGRFSDPTQRKELRTHRRSCKPGSRNRDWGVSVSQVWDGWDRKHAGYWDAISLLASVGNWTSTVVPQEAGHL